MYDSISVAIRPIGNLVFNNDTKVWRRKAPAAHAAKKVTVQLNRQSYVNRTRTKEMLRSISGKFGSKQCETTQKKDGQNLTTFDKLQVRGLILMVK